MGRTYLNNIHKNFRLVSYLDVQEPEAHGNTFPNVNTYEKLEMRIHRRVIDLTADDRAIRQLMKIKIPNDVYIELTLK